MRKFIPCIAVFCGSMALACPAPLRAQDSPAGNDSAYTALRLMAKTLGKESLDRVVEVTGRDGMPQPYLWKIILTEGADGTKEIDVTGGKITSQRAAPNPPASKAVIHFTDLNLDSSGAFDATDAQARKVRLRFDSVNYVLRTSDATGKPQWTLSLFDKEGAEVGAMRLAANDGSIVSIDGRLASGPAPAASPRPAAVATTHPRVTEPSLAQNRTSETRTTTTVTTVGPPPPPSETTTVEEVPADREEGGLFTRTGRTLDKTRDKVEQTVRRTTARVQRFFTGHGDSGEEEPRRDPDYRGD